MNTTLDTYEKYDYVMHISRCMFPVRGNLPNTFFHRATSYGKPVIVFRAQHSDDFINRENGILVDVPINIYDEGYDIDWKTNDEYLTHLELYYDEGRFQTTIEKLVDTFRFFDGPQNLSRFTQKAIEKYHECYRVELRNNNLKEIYDECYE